VSAYEQIVKTLNDAKTASPGRTRESLRRQMVRAEKAEAKAESLDKEFRLAFHPWRVKVDQAEEDMRRTKALHHTAITEAKDKLVKYEQQLTDSNNALRAAETDALEANERVVKIWEEIQRTQVAATPKRKAPDDASGSQQKRARTHG
jgi:hypothetical protein